MAKLGMLGISSIAALELILFLCVLILLICIMGLISCLIIHIGSQRFVATGETTAGMAVAVAFVALHKLHYVAARFLKYLCADAFASAAQ